MFDDTLFQDAPFDALPAHSERFGITPRQRVPHGTFDLLLKKTEVCKVKRSATEFLHRTQFGSCGFKINATSFVCVVFLCFLTSALFVAFPAACSGEIDWTIGADVAKKPAKLEISPLESASVNEIWAQVLASSFNTSVSFVNSLYDRGYNFQDIALMMEIANASKKEPSDIAVLRRKGLGWGAIAKQLGVRPAALEKANGKDSLFRRYVLAQCLAGYYGIPDTEGLALLNEKGYGFDEIAVAVNVSALSGAPLRDVIAARATGSKWRIVAEKFKMDPGKLGKPPAAYVGGKAKSKDPGKISGSVIKRKNRTADCSKTCPKKCY